MSCIDVVLTAGFFVLFATGFAGGLVILIFRKPGVTLRDVYLQGSGIYLRLPEFVTPLGALVARPLGIVAFIAFLVSFVTFFASLTIE